MKLRRVYRAIRPSHSFAHAEEAADFKLVNPFGKSKAIFARGRSHRRCHHLRCHHLSIPTSIETGIRIVLSVRALLAGISSGTFLRYFFHTRSHCLAGYPPPWFRLFHPHPAHFILSGMESKFLSRCLEYATF